MQVIIFILTCAVAFAIWQNWRLRKRCNSFADGAVREVQSVKKICDNFIDLVTALHILTDKKYTYTQIPLETMCNDIVDMMYINHEKLKGHSDTNNYYEENIKLNTMHLIGLVKYLGLKFDYKDDTRKEIVYSKPKPKTKKGKK